MKRILIAIFGLMFMSTAEAGLISISTLSNDSQVSFDYFNTSFNTVENCINGNIESVNIKDSTITIDDMASSASPGQREGDHFNSYTKTGMLPATSANLTSDISAGTSYVKSDAGIMYRVVTAATSHTYTASKDTWVYIDINGAFQFSEVALGAAQPATPDNSLLLAKVVTGAAAITSVSDLRTLSISLGTSDDRYIKGMELLWTDGDRISVDTGIVYVGTTRINPVVITGINIGTAGNYISGISERGTSKFLYVYVDTNSNIKLDDNAPDYFDTSGHTSGKKYYYKYGSDYWRCLGAIRLNATGSGEIIEFYQNGNKISYADVSGNTVVRVLDAGNATSFTSVDCSSLVPPISRLASIAEINGGGAITLSIRSHGSNATTGVSIYNASIGENYSIDNIPLSSAQAFDYKVNANSVSIYIKDYTINIRD